MVRALVGDKMNQSEKEKWKLVNQVISVLGLGSKHPLSRQNNRAPKRQRRAVVPDEEASSASVPQMNVDVFGAHADNLDKALNEAWTVRAQMCRIAEMLSK
jgi:hypothetical protein